MMKRTITLAAVAGAAVLAAQFPASASSSTAPLRLRAGLTLEIPNSWRVYRTADRVQVVTGACARPGRGYFQPKCDSFWVMGPKTLKIGAEGFGPYDPTQGPYYPASDVQRCPTDPKYGQVLGKAIVVGYRNVGVAHKAHYRVWPGRCVSYSNGGQKSTFNQREWYLPQSKILVVDQWATPGLATILKNAVWDD
ncbi:hypothetical protein AB0F88_23275 [Streptosporangium sp. NPDC023963]|uniref:hypothetical protein n=1 Tax=Streptosporangium sp. NPDC023963 TaxID=3155608 RepID=UPI00344AEBB0